jgi:osmotically-inducible protein OsmY
MTMTEERGNLDPYLAEEVREALAREPRVGELGVDVEVRGQTVVLSGTVTSAAGQDAATEVAREVVPDRRVRNETSTVDLALAAGAAVEHLP